MKLARSLLPFMSSTFLFERDYLIFPLPYKLLPVNAFLILPHSESIKGGFR
jgi:hypothetical protein